MSTCYNCELELNEQLRDMPAEWRTGIVKSLCKYRQELLSEVDCSSLKDCQTVTSLSPFFKEGDSMCISYKDEQGNVSKACFNLKSIISGVLPDLTGMCLDGDLTTMNFAEKIQAIIDALCAKVPTTTTTTSTTSTSSTTTTTTLPCPIVEDIVFEEITTTTTTTTTTQCPITFNYGYTVNSPLENISFQINEGVSVVHYSSETNQSGSFQRANGAGKVYAISLEGGSGTVDKHLYVKDETTNTVLFDGTGTDRQEYIFLGQACHTYTVVADAQDPQEPTTTSTTTTSTSTTTTSSSTTTTTTEEPKVIVGYVDFDTVPSSVQYNFIPRVKVTFSKPLVGNMKAKVGYDYTSSMRPLTSVAYPTPRTDGSVFDDEVCALDFTAQVGSVGPIVTTVACVGTENNYNMQKIVFYNVTLPSGYTLQLLPVANKPGLQIEVR